MHYTRVYYWVSSWWANRIGLASLTVSLENNNYNKRSNDITKCCINDLSNMIVAQHETITFCLLSASDYNTNCCYKHPRLKSRYRYGWVPSATGHQYMTTSTRLSTRLRLYCPLASKVLSLCHEHDLTTIL